MSNFVTVDVGGTKVLAAVVTEAGAVLARQKEKTERGSKKKLLAQIQATITSVISSANLSQSDIAGIALGVPGVVESRTGYVVDTPNTPLSDTHLAQILSDHYGLPVAVGNDVNLGVLGECWLGAGRDTTSAYGIFVGTGIGGGLVINGTLIEGARGLAGEIGHLIIPLIASESDDFEAQNSLNLEDLCSRTGIENQLRHAILNEGSKSALTEIVEDLELKRIRSRALRAALRQADPLVIEVVERASRLLGLASASVFHLVDPEVIIFGGGVVEACGDWMLPVIEKTARKLAMQGTGKKLKIVRSALGDDAIILGGVPLLRNHVGQAIVSTPLEIPALPQDQPKIPTLPLQSTQPVAPETPVAHVDKPLADTK